ncbi:hypothetical protein DFJ74DRAFT_662930 [Hyaloraphidium curvatum]|nr:hypothetical protein DFJ74DRAFT_662930 [Hyaloraphidium curvatum]
MSRAVETKQNAVRKAGCFAATTLCVKSCFVSIGRFFGSSWFAVNPTGRIFTQLLFTAAVILACCGAIPALQDLYWGWILMLFACVAAACGLFYGWNEKLCGPRMADAKNRKPGKAGNHFCMNLSSPLYYLSLITWTGFIGMAAYVLYLYIFPITRGFSSPGGMTAVPPTYCDRVTGQSGRWTAPTSDLTYCQGLQGAWERGAAVTGIAVGIVLVCSMLGSCLHAGSAMTRKILLARKIEKDQEYSKAMMMDMKQQVQAQSDMITQQQQQIQELRQGAPVQATPSGTGSTVGLAAAADAGAVAVAAAAQATLAPAVVGPPPPVSAAPVWPATEVAPATTVAAASSPLPDPSPALAPSAAPAPALSPAPAPAPAPAALAAPAPAAIQSPPAPPIASAAPAPPAALQSIPAPTIVESASAAALSAPAAIEVEAPAAIDMPKIMVTAPSGPQEPASAQAAAIADDVAVPTAPQGLVHEEVVATAPPMARPSEDQI